MIGQKRKGRSRPPMAAPLLAMGLAVLLSGCRSAATTAPVPEATASIATAPAYPSKRWVFPWSVVSGGVTSPLAMREAMQDDPVVEAHYAGLKPAAFRTETLPGDRRGYVSYRIRDKVYWTRGMVTLQAGETVLTDGQFMVRGRCGNLISFTPRQPVAPVEVEPPEIAMDQPVREAQLMLSPSLPSVLAVETKSFHNPKQIGTNVEMTSVLPAPDPQEMLPPVWTAGGISSPVFGVVVISGGGGHPTTPPSASTPAGTREPTATAPIFGPVSTTSTHIEVAPPLVISSLLFPPEPPNVTPSPFTPGNVWEHPPAPSRSPSPFYPPPRAGPPPTNPPPNTPPPGIPPPYGPPPSDPTPHGPPPTPPSLDRPPFPPPSSPPPGTPVPEPGAWVLIALGLTGIALGLFRRKF